MNSGGTKTPSWLQSSGLILWGFASGQWDIGVPLALVLWLAALPAVRNTMGPSPSDKDIHRYVDFSALATVALTAAFVASKGLSAGLLLAAGWLPVTLAPVILFAFGTGVPMRRRHLAYSQRRSTRAQANLIVDVSPIYLAITLLSAGILATPSAEFFWFMAALVMVWLFVARSEPYGRQLPSFMLAALIATGLAIAVSAGLERGHSALQQWIIDVLTDVDSDPYQSQTRIGDVGRVKLADGIVWRVEQSAPATVPLLMRSGVFTQFDGDAWIARHDAFKPITGAMPAVMPKNARRLVLRGESRRGAALLPVPTSAGALGGNVGLAERNGHGIVRLSDAPNVLAATVALEGAAASTPPGMTERSLAPKYQSLLKRLPEIAALKNKTEQQRLAGLENWFAAHFRYTLFLGDEQQGRRDIERFLLDDRAGHCEYFGTATVLLLRALGIPARYVTGYSVQEYSRLEEAFVVRQQHAHAWAEAFVDGRWIEVDTTPASWLAVEEQNASVWRPLFDLISFAGRQFSEWRAKLTSGSYSGIMAPLGALGTIGVLLWLAWPTLKRIWRGRAKRSTNNGTSTRLIAEGRTPAADVEAFRRLEADLKKLGLERSPAEPPRAWLRRVAADGVSVLDEIQLVAAHQVVARLYHSRYGR